MVGHRRHLPFLAPVHQHDPNPAPAGPPTDPPPAAGVTGRLTARPRRPAAALLRGVGSQDHMARRAAIESERTHLITLCGCLALGSAARRVTACDRPTPRAGRVSTARRPWPARRHLRHAHLLLRHRPLAEVLRPSTRPRPARRPRRRPGSNAAGRRRRSGGATPSASRRAVSRKPVWPTMRCCGRTARPSRCHPRTIDSHALGSVKRPSSRIASATRESWVAVAT